MSYPSFLLSSATKGSPTVITSFTVLVVAESGVSGDLDGFGLAVVGKVGLLEVRVSLDLVDGGNDLGLGHKISETVFGEV